MAKWTSLEEAVEGARVGLVVFPAGIVSDHPRDDRRPGRQRHELGPHRGHSTGCQLRVSAAELRVRSGPSTDADQVEVLSEGAVVDGTRVVTDGFRELEGDRWAADQFLTPMPNTNCG